MSSIAPLPAKGPSSPEMLPALVEFVAAWQSSEQFEPQQLADLFLRGWSAEAVGIWQTERESTRTVLCGQSGPALAALFSPETEHARQELLERSRNESLPTIQRVTWMEGANGLSVPFEQRGHPYVLLAQFPASLDASRKLTLLHGTQLLRLLLQSRDRRQAGGFTDSTVPAAALLRFYSSLDWRTTVYTIVNESRQLLNCDRVTVLVKQGTGYRVVGVSGQVEFDRRANQVRGIEQLTTATMVWAEPFRYPSSTPLPSEFDVPLQEYLTEAPTRWLEIHPLRVHTESNADPALAATSSGLPWAAFVVEDFRSTTPTASDECLQIVTATASRALSHAQDYRHIPLRSLWQSLSRLTRADGYRRTRLLMAAIGLLIVGMLAFVPVTFKVRADGTMVPANQRHLFAVVGGITHEIAVKHGDRVKQGDVLLQLTNADLSAQISDLSGQASVITQQLASIRSIRLGPSEHKTSEELDRLAGEEQRLTRQHQSLETQLQILRTQESALTIRSPIDGMVVTWDVEQLLAGRPVERGQRLLTIADIEGEWELELHVADRHAGVVRAAHEQRQAAQQGPIPVTFVLGTQPRERHSAHVTLISDAAQPSTRHGAELPLRASVDTPSLRSTLHVSAEVRASLDCGQTALGYQLFHELIDYVYTRAMLWWPTRSDGT